MEAAISTVIRAGRSLTRRDNSTMQRGRANWAVRKDLTHENLDASCGLNSNLKLLAFLERQSEGGEELRNKFQVLQTDNLDR